jgi:transposase
MVEKHWDGIASYCHPDNKVSLGLVEGINNKIRVVQRRAYGYRDEEYLKLKTSPHSCLRYPKTLKSTHTIPRRSIKVKE